MLAVPRLRMDRLVRFDRATEKKTYSEKRKSLNNVQFEGDIWQGFVEACINLFTFAGYNINIDGR